MKGRILGGVLILLAGCSSAEEEHAVPSVADIQRLEAKLANHPCIGKLDEWERNYRYSRRSGTFFSYPLVPDLEVIEFHLRRASTINISPGRNIMESAPNGDWPDSNPIQSIDGRFALANDALMMPRCRRVS